MAEVEFSSKHPGKQHSGFYTRVLAQGQCVLCLWCHAFVRIDNRTPTPTPTPNGLQQSSLPDSYSTYMEVTSPQSIQGDLIQTFRYKLRVWMTRQFYTFFGRRCARLLGHRYFSFQVPTEGNCATHPSAGDKTRLSKFCIRLLHQY